MFRSLIFILFILFSVGASAQKIYVVSIGIADYPGTKNDLKLSANDAKAVYRLYIQNTVSEAKLLTNERATRDNILTKARNLFAKAGKDDIVVLFFSGHGYKGGFVAYDNMLSYQDVKKLFSACKSNNKMIFADACFSGGLREGVGAKGVLDKDVMLFMSSRSKETSLELRGMRNGLFTACLVRCLKGGADVNHDRIITAKELYQSVSQGVKELSVDKQHPVMWGSFDDNMPVMIW